MRSEVGWLPNSSATGLFESKASATSTESEAPDAPLFDDSVLLQELPEWQNPDGEELLAAALRQEEALRP